MANYCRDVTISSLFIFDHTVLKREEDDLKDAILYFYPHTVSNDNQCALVGKIIGISDFLMETLPKSPPKIIKLQKEKFAMKRTGCYSIGLGSSLLVADIFLSAHMEFVWKTFTFFQGGMTAVKQRLEKPTFLQELEKIWDSYLLFCQFYGDVLSQAFQILPSVNLSKSDRSVFLRASHILQRSTKQDGVLGGVLVHRNKVLCTQLSPGLTKCLLMLKSHQFPSLLLKVDFEKPDSVRLLTVFLSNEEYQQIGFRRTSFLHRKSRKTNQSPNSDYRQFDKDTVGAENVNLSTLPTVCCSTSATDVSVSAVHRETTLDQQQHQNVSVSYSESLNDETSEGRSVIDMSKSEHSEIAEDNVPTGYPLKCASGQQGEALRTVNGLSKSLTEHQFLEQCHLSQVGENNTVSVGENNTVSHGQSESNVSTLYDRLSSSSQILSDQTGDQNQCLKDDTLTSPGLISSLSHNEQEISNASLECSSTNINIDHETNIRSEITFQKNRPGEGMSLSVNQPEQTELLKEHDSNQNQPEQTEHLKEHDSSQPEQREHLKEHDSSQPEQIEHLKEHDSSQPEQTEHLKEHDTNQPEQIEHIKEHNSPIDNSDSEIIDDSLVESERLTNIYVSQNRFCVEHGSSMCDCNCDPVTTEGKLLPGELADSSYVAGLKDGDSQTAPILTMVDHSHQSSVTSRSGSSPLSRDNSYDDKLFVVSGGSFTSASEEKISSHTESLHFPPSPGLRSSSRVSEERSNKAEGPVPLNFCETSSSDLPQSSDSYPNSPQSDAWVPSAEGLVDLVLYVQGHSEMMLLLLLDHGCRCDYTLVNNLWKFSLPNLAELDFQVKDCLDEISQDRSQRHLEHYSYLRNDSFSQSLTGNVMESVLGSSHEFVDTSIRIHQNFQESDTLTDVTLCSHKASVYGHRSVNHETFFQLNTAPPPSKELAFTLAQAAKHKLRTDHGISML